MATFNFPENPALNELYTANGVTWQWNGTNLVGGKLYYLLLKLIHFMIMGPNLRLEFKLAHTP